MENADRILNGCLRRYTLNGLDNDFLCLLIGIQFCIVYNLIDIACSIESGLIFQTFNESVLSFFGTESREFFKLGLLLLLHFLQFLLLYRQEFFLIINTLLTLINLHLAAS